MSVAAPSSLRAFLSAARKSLNTAIANGKPVNLVIGNESADLDSITSSLVYAYLRSTTPSPNGSVYVPVLNIPAADVRIRPELAALLPHANIDAGHLITLDDLPPVVPGGAAGAAADDGADRGRRALVPELTRWILVDHNALQGALGEVYAGRVVGCIDHHVDEKTFVGDGRSGGGDPRLITKSGSCQSLVVNHFREAWDRLSSTASSSSRNVGGQGDAGAGSDDVAVRRTWDMQVAKLALASILIDTHDLKSTDKVTEHDLEAAKYLESRILIAPGAAGFDRSSFFQQISEAKGDLDGLTLPELLRKDYKQWREDGRRLGICAAVKPLSYLKEKCKGDDFYRELQAYGEERDLAILGVMTATTMEGTGEFQRELMLCVLDPTCEKIVEDFAETIGKGLDLDASHELAKGGTAGCPTKVWWQRDLSRSRKQVAPLLRQAMNKNGQLSSSAKVML